MAEQILHGSNVVTAAEQGRRERVAEGVRCGGLRDACLFYGTFEGALKGLVITCDGDARHRSVDRSNACAAQKPRTTAGNARRADTSAQGRREAQRRCGPRPWSFSHHARARDSCSRRLGAKLSGNIKARSLEPLPSRTMIVP